MAQVLATNKLNLPIGSLDAYIQRAFDAPILSQQEEFELAKKLYENNDIQAAKQLVVAHLKFVIKIAKGYSGYGLPVGDLIQEGNVGLMKAVKKFNPHMGVRLVSFAVHWIKSEMHEYIIKNWRIVKIATTKAQRKLFFNIRKLKKRLGWFTKEEIESVAKDLQVSPKEVLRMEQRLNSIEASFDNSENESTDNTPLSPSKYLTNDSDEPTYIIEKEQKETLNKYILQTAINELDHRSKDILVTRWLSNEKVTLQELAKKHKVSIERIRQIEKEAISKLKKHVTLQS